MNKDKFDEEVRRGLDFVEHRTTYTDWVNPQDRKDHKAYSLVDPHEYKEKVGESVDGLPIKDRDLVDSDVEVVVPRVEDTPKRFASETDGTVSNSAPTGTVREVMEWVDGDPERAQTALDEENEKETPRKSLVEKLEDVIGE